MTYKLWQKKLKLNYSNDVIDIVQFGSSVIDETIPKDIDIAVIFQKIPLKEQLNQAQAIKKQLQDKTDLPIHISSFDFYSFFTIGNFAKEDLLFYGKSILTGDHFAKRFNLHPQLQITYNLSKLKKKDKVRFNYLLNGKKGNYGLIKKHGGKLLNPGLIEIYPECEKIFTEHISEITSDFKLKKVFIQS